LYGAALTFGPFGPGPGTTGSKRRPGWPVCTMLCMPQPGFDLVCRYFGAQYATFTFRILVKEPKSSPNTLFAGLRMPLRAYAIALG
ncbi:MAG TPA: hypothetical protein VIS10_01945, partial [Anaerolineales bacterium]